MNVRPFDIEASKRYWRFAPSGAGKHDTSDLLLVDDRAFLREWSVAFRKRFSNYIEEDCFLSCMADALRGKRVASIGSGLGLHEVYYAANGASMTCYDIVASNIRVIDRLASMLGLSVKTRLLDANVKLAGKYDAVFIYGSLMTMPEDRQEELLHAAASCLEPGGVIYLMLYTWTFAEQACGWTSTDQFDPAVFARATDPSVGAEHCPWSDWHDDEKLLRVAPSGMAIRKKQHWQQGWFVWYEIGHAVDAVEPFFDLETECGTAILELPPAAFEAAAARLAVKAGSLEITTEPTLASYAAASASFDATAATDVSFVAELQEGAFSCGLLGLAEDRFLGSCQVVQAGKRLHAFSIFESAASARLIFSNFRTSPAASRFVLSEITLRQRTSPSLLFLRERVQTVLAP